MDITSSPGTREIIFETEIPLEEDVVAELENFILISRLGLVDEAVQLYERVLWKHMEQFPVFAEAVAFLVEHNEYARLQKLVTSMESRCLGFDEPEETEFFNFLLALDDVFAQKYSFAESGLTHCDLIVLITDPVTYQSPIKILMMQIIIHVASRLGDLNCLLNATTFGLHIYNLLENELFWDATQMIIVLAKEHVRSRHRPTAMGRFELWYRKLEDALSAMDNKSYPDSEALRPHDNPNFLLCQLVAKTAFMELICAGIPKAFKGYEALELFHKDLELIQIKMFEKLSNTTPRGVYFNSWKAVQPALKPDSLPAARQTYILLAPLGRPLIHSSSRVRTRLNMHRLSSISLWATRYLKEFDQFDDIVMTKSTCAVRGVFFLGRCKRRLSPVYPGTRTDLEAKLTKSGVDVSLLLEYIILSSCPCHQPMMKDYILGWRVALRWQHDLLRKDAQDITELVSETLDADVVRVIAQPRLLDILNMIRAASFRSTNDLRRCAQLEEEYVYNEASQQHETSKSLSPEPSSSTEFELVHRVRPPSLNQGHDNAIIFEMDPVFAMNLLGEALAALALIQGDIGVPEPGADDSGAVKSTFILYDPQGNPISTADDSVRAMHSLARKFYSKRPPQISLENYLSRLHKYCPMSTAVYLAAGHYIINLDTRRRVIRVASRSVHRLVLAALYVAMKSLEDLSWSHARFAKVTGVSSTELNRLEIAFCFITNFDLQVSGTILTETAMHLNGLQGSNSEFKLPSSGRDLKADEILMKPRQEQEAGSGTSMDHAESLVSIGRPKNRVAIVATD